VKVEPRSNNAIAAGLSSFRPTHHQALDLAPHPAKAHPTDRRLRARDRALVNDYQSDAAYADLPTAWFGNLARVLRPGGAFYIWGGYANVANYPLAIQAAGLYFSQAIIWVKEHPVLTRKDFMGTHEWCFYGWREGAAHSFFGPPNIPDVWPVKKANPAAMVARGFRLVRWSSLCARCPLSGRIRDPPDVKHWRPRCSPRQKWSGLGG
jgi:DNA modification methylase